MQWLKQLCVESLCPYKYIIKLPGKKIHIVLYVKHTSITFTSRPPLSKEVYSDIDDTNTRTPTGKNKKRAAQQTPTRKHDALTFK